MTDVLMHHTADGGEIEIVNGRITLADGLRTSAYISLFGGNERDGGGTSTEHLQWWGNLGETETTRHIRSETQHLLRSIPAIPANLRRIEDAASRDLAWMVGIVAESVSVAASMPGLNRVDITVDIVVDGQSFPFTFAERWSSE